MYVVWNTCIARLCLGLKTTKILKVVDREQVLVRRVTVSHLEPR